MLNRLKSRVKLERTKSRGYVTVHGQRIYFPPESEAALRFAQTGQYEPDIAACMSVAAASDTTVFDVGANVGISVAHLLAQKSGVRVVSFEVSPVVLPHLMRTHGESPYREFWEVVPKAVSERAGERVSFVSHAEAGGVYDGLQETNRISGRADKTLVETTSLDHEWQQRGCPKVSLIKIDVEGGELGVLRGSTACLAGSRPAVLTEWYPGNFSAYGVPAGAILDFADAVNYRVYLVPEMVRASCRRLFAYQIALNYNLLMLPDDGPLPA